MKITVSLICFLGGIVPFIWGQSPIDYSAIELPDLNQITYPLSSLTGNQATVFFFLSADCPLCENYSVTINQLRQEYQEDEVAFIGLFAGKYVVKKDVEAYLKEFDPKVTVLLDLNYKMMNLFEATVTPEVFAIDAKGDLFYQGKIDNWIASLGKYRTNITRNFLKDALDAQLAGKPIVVPKTQAVGCFIE